MTTTFSTPPDVTIADSYLNVAVVARRLGLPVDLVTRRVEAGDVPARRIELEDGSVTWELRLSDLGIDLDEELVSTFSTYEEPTTFIAYDLRNPIEEDLPGVIQLTGTSEAARDEFEVVERNTSGNATAEFDEPLEFVSPEEVRAQADVDGTSALESDSANVSIDEMVPPPARQAAHLTVVGEDYGDPGTDLSRMAIDSRELVGGLLDRWERTLEQRIYAEQRQRFEAELLARQTMLREAQLELKAVRAENAASKAEHSRVLADRDRALLDAQRELDQARRAAHQAQIQLQATEKRKRGWFFRR